VTDSKPSKSARKREQLELQELGEQLIELNDHELISLSLDERLETAIRNATRITSHGALRRQKQLIGKLMRNVNAGPIRATLALLRADEARAKRLFAKAERWRDRLIKEGSAALASFDSNSGGPDAELRTLLSELEFTSSEKAEKTVKRKIFRRVHGILVKLLQ
jgi:ribosome-associated protein